MDDRAGWKRPGAGRSRRVRSGLVLVLAGIAAVAVAIPAGQSAAPKVVNCNQLPHWSNFSSGPQVNQTHIFCGEFSNGRPKGFHSRPGGATPRTVARLTVSQTPNSRGIYGVRWSHAADPDRNKFSTMFPDRCSQGQVLESIRYAAQNRIACPSGAPDWAWCGYNRPGSNVVNSTGSTNLNRFCSSNDGQRFVIAGAFLRGRDRINTAFPLR